MAERPTPRSIALGTLIAMHSDPSFDLCDGENDKEEQEGNDKLWDMLQRLVVGAQADNSTGQSLDELLLHVHRCAGKKTCDLVLEYVGMSANSVDALVDLIESLRASVAEGIVDGNSSYGVYLRKICLGFDELSFEAMTRLWEALRTSVDHTKRKLSSSPPTPTLDDSGEMSEESKSSNDVEWLWPDATEHTEKSLRRLCLEMEKGGNESYEETELKIQSILKRDPELPTAHFLRFLNCLNSNERVGAIDALHQYFDYAMIKDQKESKGKPKQDVLQYAAVVLAALHSSFGDSELSYNATEEAVRVAQASGDKACVAYALGWLHHTTKQPFGSDELLQRCSSRAASSKLRSLSGGANLELARHYLTAPSHRGRRTVQHLAPAKAWERVMESAADRNATSTTLVMDSPTHMADFPSSKDALDILARQCLVGSGVWDSFGFAPLSGLSSFVALHCFRDHMSTREASMAMQDIARVALYGYGPHTIPMSCKKPGELGVRPRSSLPGDKSAPHCIYAESLRKLMDLKREYPDPGCSSWKISVFLVLHEWAVRRGELAHAGSLSHLLLSCLHPQIPNYREVMLEAYGQRALLLSREGSWDRAKHLMKRLCAMSKDWGLRTQQARFFIQLAVVIIEASPHNHINALSPLLECLALCEEFSMDSLHATALSLLAKVQLQLHNVNRAVSLLKAALPSLLRGSHIWFQGEAFLTLAKCDLYQAKNCQRENQRSKQNKLVRSVSRYLERSCRYFESCHDMFRLREIFYLQARLYNEIPGHTEKRNECSRKFKRVCSHLVKANSPVWPDALEMLESEAGLEKLAARQLPTFGPDKF